MHGEPWGDPKAAPRRWDYITPLALECFLGRWLRRGWSWHPFWHCCSHNQGFDTQRKMEKKQMRPHVNMSIFVFFSEKVGKQQWSGFPAFFTGVAGLSTTALPLGRLWQVAAQTVSVLSHNKLTQACPHQQQQSQRRAARWCSSVPDFLLLQLLHFHCERVLNQGKQIELVE